MINADLVARLAQWANRGPRYTSYPPATEFAAMPVEQVGRELGRVAALGESISLYVHIPFCRSLCWYCGCNVIPTRDASRGVSYVEQLAAELRLVGQRVGRAAVTEICLGGGSPNFLSPASLHQLFEAIDDNFAIAPGTRRSIELDPRSTTSSQIDALAAAGFRSMSMGVQDFSAAVQDAIHRHQTQLQTRWLVDRARGAGFEDINVDVVYGLPLQTEASFARTLDALIDLAPDRIALFGYAHLPSKLPRQRLVERAGRVRAIFTSASITSRGPDRGWRARRRVDGSLGHFRATSSAAPTSCSASACRRSRRRRGCTGRTTASCLHGRVTSPRACCRWRAASSSMTMIACAAPSSSA